MTSEFNYYMQLILKGTHKTSDSVDRDDIATHDATHMKYFVVFVDDSVMLVLKCFESSYAIYHAGWFKIHVHL